MAVAAGEALHLRLRPLLASHPSSSPATLGFFSSVRRAPPCASSPSRTPSPVLYPLRPRLPLHLSGLPRRRRRWPRLPGPVLLPGVASAVVAGGGGVRLQHWRAAGDVRSLTCGPHAQRAHTPVTQRLVPSRWCDGFGMGRRIQGILGSSAAEQTAEMDEMYAGMLRKPEKLAGEVEKSDHRVLHQENRNLLLRFRFL